MFGEGASVRVPFETNPDAGGGPIRLATNPVYRNTLAPTRTYRSPHAMVNDTEPGGARWPGIDRMRWWPDGRLALAPAATALGATVSELLLPTIIGLSAAGVLGIVAISSLYGVVFAEPGHKFRGLGRGVIAGAGTVAIMAGVIKLGAYLAAKEAKTPTT